MLPAVLDREVGVALLVGHAHPADQDTPAASGLEGLRCVEVEPGVPQRKGLELAIAQDIPRHHEVARLVHVATVPIASLQPLRRDREHLGDRSRPASVVGNLKVVGALPHVAKGLVRGNAVHETPGVHVIGLEDQHLTRVVLLAGTLHHVVLVAGAPHLGVAYVVGVVHGIVGVLEDQALVLEVLAVLARDVHGVGLATIRHVVVVLCVFALDVARVEHVHGAVLHQRTAGVHAAHVERLVGIERRSLILPQNHVLARTVSPHLHATLGVEGRVLEVGVERVPKLGEAVRIVQPADGRGEVKRLGVWPLVGAAFHNLSQRVEVCSKRIAHVCSLGESVLVERQTLRQIILVGWFPVTHGAKSSTSAH